MLFAFPAAIAIPIIAGLLLGGPALGFLAAILLALVIVGVAIAMRPRRERGAGAPGPRARRTAAARFLVPLAIAATGAVLILAAGGTVRIIGWGVVALAVTVAISLMFLEVGLSEDRAREGRRTR